MSLESIGRTHVEDRPGSAFLSPVSTRGIFAALALIGFANGISEKVIQSVERAGLAAAAFNTFDVSVFLWGGIASVVLLLRHADPSPASKADLRIGALALAAFAMPVPAASWLGIVVLGLHMLRAAKGDGHARKAALILLATTVPPFWARILFAAFSEIILRIDAVLVGWFVGTVPTGNIVPFADGSGSMFFAPACSSISNLSLSLLCNTVFFVLRNRKSSASRMLICAVMSACLVVSINVARIGLIGRNPGFYDLLHGPAGSMVFGWATTFAIVAMSVIGSGGRDPASR